MNMCVTGRWTALTAPTRSVAAPSALRVSGAGQVFHCIVAHFWFVTHQMRNTILLLLFKCFDFGLYIHTLELAIDYILQKTIRLIK